MNIFQFKNNSYDCYDFQTIQLISFLICQCLCRYIGQDESLHLFLLFGVVNGVKYTSSKRMYILRLYLASIVMAVIQMSTQIELNFFRTLFIVACICEILEIRKNQKAVSWIKVLSLYIAYQVIVCIVCGYLSSISNMYTETICFYLIPALLGSVFTTEGGLIFVVLGIIMYLSL